MDVKHDQKQNKEEKEDNGMNKNGGKAGLQVHELKGPFRSRHLNDHPGREKREQNRSDQRSCQISHPFIPEKKNG